MSTPVHGFRHRGFYLHEGWFFKHPFAVRAWTRRDFAGMFRLLRHLGFDRVMIWPMLESVPMPLSEADAAAVREFRDTVGDAREAGLECWVTMAANCAAAPALAARPWRERNPFPSWTYVDLGDPVRSAPFLAHRSALLAIVNNADAYVTIDGDPGGLPGSPPTVWMRVFDSDRAALDRHGVDPSRQRLIPWIWCGWGTRGVWQQPIEAFTRAEMELIAKVMPEPWGLLPGRSYRDGHANGRINVAFAEELGLIPRSTLFCYEAVEFEPTPPASVLQFDIIRRNLREESRFAASAEGVFGNAQQPVMVLPNLYFFARASRDLSYLDTPDEQVLRDLAAFLGGPPELLIPAWACLQLGLDRLPADLPGLLRSASLPGEIAACIPGGPARYLDILACQVECRIGVLRAVDGPPASFSDAVRRTADGIGALVSWWKVHRYVYDGNGDEPFRWRFANKAAVAQLGSWVRCHATDAPALADPVGRLLADRSVLGEAEGRRLALELADGRAEGQ
jgi:hypothetical protein